jgi:hypothetical protein
MRAGEEVADHAVIFGLRSEMITDAHHAGGLFRGRPGHVDGGEAGGVGLDRPGVRRHGVHSAADTRWSGPRVMRKHGRAVGHGVQ